MQDEEELIQVFSTLDSPAEMRRFFEEIFTPRERADLVLRWKLLKELYRGKPQRAIAAENRLSLCKITRGSKILKAKDSITYRILTRYYEGRTKP